MKRTTIKPTDEVDARLRDEAERRGTTISELSREAIQTYLGMGARRALGGGRVWHSGQSDVSTRLEEILRMEAAEQPSWSTPAPR